MVSTCCVANFSAQFACAAAHHCLVRATQGCRSWSSDELLLEVVTDPVNVRSQNLVYVDGQRRAGNHNCIVDDLGISALLEGRPASCLRTEPGHCTPS